MDQSMFEEKFITAHFDRNISFMTFYTLKSMKKFHFNHKNSDDFLSSTTNNAIFQPNFLNITLFYMPVTKS